MTGINLYPANCPLQRHLISLGVGLLIVCFGAGVSLAQSQNGAVSGENGSQTGTEKSREPAEAPNLRELIEASAQMSIDLAANSRPLQRFAVIAGNTKAIQSKTTVGDSALKFELLCRSDDFDNRLRVIGELNQEIEKRFREHAIEIPFPQRDLHLREADVKFLGSQSNPQHGSDGFGDEAQRVSDDHPAGSGQERYPRMAFAKSCETPLYTPQNISTICDCDGQVSRQRTVIFITG